MIACMAGVGFSIPGCKFSTPGSPPPGSLAVTAFRLKACYR